MSLIWCPNCEQQQEVTIIRGTSDSRCNRCSEVIGKQFRVTGVAPTRKKKIKKKKKRANATGASNASTRPAIQLATSKSTDRENDELQFRMDAPHDSSVEFQFQPIAGNSSQRRKAAREVREVIERDAFLPPIHLAGFSIFLFLIGQIIAVWSFIDGSFVPFTLGNLASIFGVVLGLWTLTARLGKLETERREMMLRVSNLERKARVKEPIDRATDPPQKFVIRPRTGRRKRKPGMRPESSLTSE